MRFLLLIIFLGLVVHSKAQTRDFFSPDSLRTDLSILASDSFKGRRTLSPEIKKAAEYISEHFRRLNLQGVNSQQSYYSPFIIGNPTREELKVNGEIVLPRQYYTITTSDLPPTFSEKEISVQKIYATSSSELFHSIRQIISSPTPVLIQLSEKQSDFMGIIEDSLSILRQQVQSYVIIYPTNDSIKTISLQLSKKAEEALAYNIIGVLPGKKNPSEYVVISAHYDHVGYKKSQTPGEDTIFNGANDNASGVTAMLAFAKYLAYKNDNARTVIFIAFSGEEMGLLGSQYLSLRMSTEKIKAMLNLEMLGKPDLEDSSPLRITGGDLSDLYNIMKKYPGKVKLIKDYAVTQNLHMRSDHFPFFNKGVVAHTFMYYSSLDNDYHKVTDDIHTIDFPNFSNTLQTLLPGFEAIISGKETPKRQIK
jgi:hypothetical protein